MYNQFFIFKQSHFQENTLFRTFFCICFPVFSPKVLILKITCMKFQAKICAAIKGPVELNDSVRGHF